MNGSSFTLQASENDTVSELKKMLMTYDNGRRNILVLIWNENDQFIYLSDQTEKLIDRDESDINLLKWMDFFPKTTVTEIQNHFSVSDSRLELDSFTFEEEIKNVGALQGVIDLFTIHNEVYYLCQLSNITTEKDWKDFLVDIEKQILSSQMTASLVHEIRNPLTSLKGFLQLVQSGIEQKEEYYKVIIHEIEKLEHITSELLQLSRPTKQKKEKECMKKLIEDVIFLLETQMNMKDVEFDFYMKGNLYVNGNASQIKQVFINLIKNGIEAMGNKGQIKIYAYQEDENIHIEINDKGNGISQDAVAELNSPFYTTKADGTGLGLVVTNHILTDHQGELRVSTEENKGTTFTVILPIYSGSLEHP